MAALRSKETGEMSNDDPPPKQEAASPVKAGSEDPHDPKADVNGERPPWYGIEVSMVNSATKTETKSVTIGSVLEDTRNGRWNIPVATALFTGRRTELGAASSR